MSGVTQGPKDYLLETAAPRELDRIVQTMGAALIESSPGRYLMEDGAYILRCFTNPDYVVWAIYAQQYGTIRKDEAGKPVEATKGGL